MFTVIQKNQVSEALNNYFLCFISLIPETVLDYTIEAKSFMASDYGIELKRKRDEEMKKALEETGHYTFRPDEYTYRTPMHEVPNPEYDEETRTHYAFFTPNPVLEQWGDDWDDELHSAGEPYDEMDKREVEIIEIPFKVNEDYMNLPAEDHFSARDINERAVAWIHDTRHHCSILAGATPLEFVEFISKGD